MATRYEVRELNARVQYRFIIRDTVTGVDVRRADASLRQFKTREAAERAARKLNNEAAKVRP